MISWKVLLFALGALAPTPAAKLCFTQGSAETSTSKSVEGRLSIAVPKMRAIAQGTTGDSAELSFVYLGPTAQTAALGSGEIRRQIGLKLRAQDGCNLLYVMWRLDPKPGIVVSIKRNPGSSQHSECGNRGYRNLLAQKARATPVIKPGSSHSLRADIEGLKVLVWTDGILVWQGALDADAALLKGPVGVRTDNFAADIELRAPRGSSAAPGTCEQGRED
jgi:hypothetical protein